MAASVPLDGLSGSVARARTAAAGRVRELVMAEPGSRTGEQRRNLGRFAALLVLGTLVLYVIARGLMGGYRSSDWPNLLMLGHLLTTAPAQVYDRHSQALLQRSLLGPGGFVGHANGLLSLSSPPWLGLVTAPVGALGVVYGGIAWSLLQLLTLLAGLRLLAKDRTDALYAAATIPTLVLLANANVVGLVVLGLGLSWRLHRSHPWLAGIALGLALIRPNVLILFPFAFLLTRSWRLLGGSALALAGLILIDELIHPGLTFSWVGAALAQAGHIGSELTPAGLGWLLGYHLGWAFSALGLAIALFLTRGRGAGLYPATLLAAPHALVQSLLLVSAGLAAGRRCRPPELALLNLGAIVLILVAGNHVAESLIGSLLLVTFTFLLRDALPAEVRQAASSKTSAWEAQGAHRAALSPWPRPRALRADPKSARPPGDGMSSELVS